IGRRPHLGGMARAPALEGAADFEELAHPMRLGLDQLDQRPVSRRLRPARDHEATGAVAHLDEADELGMIDRLADGLPAGLEQRGELALGGQLAAGRKAPRADEFRDLVEHLGRLAPPLRGRKGAARALLERFATATAPLRRTSATLRRRPAGCRGSTCCVNPAQPRGCHRTRVARVVKIALLESLQVPPLYHFGAL